MPQRWWDSIQNEGSILQKDIIIEITGTQNSGGEPDHVEFIAQGQMDYADGLWCITYDENDFSERLTTKTMLTVDGKKCVTMSRFGEQNTQLILEKGKRHLCHYDTGCGGMLVGISTSAVHSSLTGRGGELRMRYTVDINSGYVGSNEINIKIKEAPPPCQN